MAVQKRSSWISQAIRRPGDLRRKAAAAGAITHNNKIDIRWARKMAKGGPNVDPLTARQARFYLNVLRPMNLRRSQQQAAKRK